MISYINIFMLAILPLNFPVVSVVKNMPASGGNMGSIPKLGRWETRVQSLNWEDPLEKEMGTHSSILAWKIPWTEEPGGLQSMGFMRTRACACTHTRRCTFFY